MNSTPALLFRYLILDVIVDVFRFPVWWYTRGVVHAWVWYRSSVRNTSDALALVVLLKNLGRPMFGDYTKEGRAISFGVRIVQLIVSLTIFVVWWAMLSLLCISWLLVIPAILLLIIYTFPHG